MRDHGGNIDWAIQSFGGKAEDWIDLSTGINRCAYPVPQIAPETWRALPTAEAIAALNEAAKQRYATRAPILATAGAQAAIQLIPHLAPPGEARVLGPTYNEHAASLRAAGWRVSEVARLTELDGADLGVVVNPNNPDGRRHLSDDLLERLNKVGRLVVDESFADADPEISVASSAGREKLLVLRSFGKFYGLGGLRLGFILGCNADIEVLRTMAGPWPVSGPALDIGRTALQDGEWAERTKHRLQQDTERLDNLARTADWSLVGGTHLFRLYETRDARSMQNSLAQAHIWSRIFPRSATWVRLGLPGSTLEWERLTSAMRGLH